MKYLPTTALLIAVESPQQDFVPRSVANWSPATAWSLAAGVWLILMVNCVAVGWPQMKDAKGSLSRLLSVSFFLSFVNGLPAIVFAMFASQGDVFFDQCLIAAGSTFYCLLSCSLYLLPPVILRGTKEKLPLVSDEQFLCRVESLAKKMHTPVPLVRLWPSINGTQQALAFAGTLHAPQLVVTDGILHRLKSDECDAIVAHELAHLVNGSLYVLSAVTPVGLATTTAFAFLFPLSISIPFGLALLIGVRRVVSRYFEFDCDYRAAQVAGFQSTASALSKIHAVHPISNSGILSLMVYATATHPSRDVRLASLYDAAPLHDRPHSVPDTALISKHNRVAIGTATIWAVSIFGTLVVSLLGRTDWWLSIPLWIVALMPVTLMSVSVRKHFQISHRRSGERWGFLGLLGLGTAIAFGIVIIFVVTFLAVASILDDPVKEGRPHDIVIPTIVFGATLTAVIIGGLYSWRILTRKRQTLRREVNVAIQLHDFRRVIELCAAAPEIVRRFYKLRYVQALAVAVCGNRQAAINSLEQLWIDKPDFPLAALALAELLLDSDLAVRAIEIVNSVEPRLPRDPAVPLLKARAFRRLGRTNDASAACKRASSFEPNDGYIRAVEAAIKLDLEHVHQAEELINQALEMAPGEPYVLVVRAEIALRVGHGDASDSAVFEATNAVQASPLTFLSHEIARLNAAIEKRSSNAHSSLPVDNNDRLSL